MRTDVCCKVKDSGIRRGELCGAKAKVVIDGKGYCGNHNPQKPKGVGIKARAEVNKRLLELDMARLDVVETAKKWSKGDAYSKDLVEVITKLMALEDKHNG